MSERIKGYLEGANKGTQLVGAKNGNGYHGPVAHVSHDKNWLHVTTDDYEGHAMLNIEALPFLIKALRTIQRERRTPPATAKTK